MDNHLDQAPCGYFTLSDAGTILSANRTLLDMLRCDRESLVGHSIETTMSATSKLFYHTYFSPYIQLYGRVDEMYLTLRASDGEDVPVLLNGARLQREGTDTVVCVVVPMRKRIEHEKEVLEAKMKLEDLYKATSEANRKLEGLQQEYERKQEELMRINEQLETMAATDALTGLKNRRFFHERLQEALTAYQESLVPFSLLILDIDHFKRINDTFGHPVGDLVLAGLATLLRTMSRIDDTVARYGGEEFVLMLPNTGLESAVQAANRFCAAAAATPCGGHSITVSIGAATVSWKDTYETLLQRADSALYTSKSEGRNRVTHASVLMSGATISSTC